MLLQYKNIEQINSATESVSGERISKAKTNFFSYGQDTRVVQVPELSSQASNVKIELHAYAGDSWITGNHQIQLNSKIPQYKNKDRSTVQFPGRPLAIDLYNEFAKLKLTSGNFRIVVNFLKDLTLSKSCLSVYFLTLFIVQFFYLPLKVKQLITQVQE